MLFEPSVMVLYVENPAISSQFYQDLLGIVPKEASPTFHSLQLSNGMHLAFKARHAVIPPMEQANGSSELAFTVSDHKKVDEWFLRWQAKNIAMIASPSKMPYGYTFVALDPDGNRLRVVSLEHSL